MQNPKGKPKKEIAFFLLPMFFGSVLGVSIPYSIFGKIHLDFRENPCKTPPRKTKIDFFFFSSCVFRMT